MSLPGFSGILLWFGIKFLFAAGSAEVILLTFVLAGELCRFFINGHLTDRINRHTFHLTYLPFFASGIYFLSCRERLITVTELSAIARAASSGLNTIPKNG
jgi:hypothetical protein